MFSAIENWLFKNAAAKALKGLLDKIPGDGGKTILGFLLLVLGDVAATVPNAPYIAYVKTLIEVVNALGPNIVQDAGLVALIGGAIHKILKVFNKDIPDSPVVAQ